MKNMTYLMAKTNMFCSLQILKLANCKILDGTTSDVLNFIKNKLVISNDECSKNYGNIDKSILCIEGRNNQSICGASCEFITHSLLIIFT
jgi:hypothetical protein